MTENQQRLTLRFTVMVELTEEKLRDVFKNETRQKIFNYLRQHPDSRIPDIVKDLNITRGQFYYAIDILIGAALVEKNGYQPGVTFSINQSLLSNNDFWGMVEETQKTG